MKASLVRFALVDLAGSLVYAALLWSMGEVLAWPALPASCCAFLLVVAGTVVVCNFVGTQRIFRARRTFYHGKDRA